MTIASKGDSGDQLSPMEIRFGCDLRRWNGLALGRKIEQSGVTGEGP
jgi:hypothetical protein